ncbi:MAG: dihydrodipicolinate synthase family protein [Candidatus Sigynarchaeota archaeon]
MNIEKTKGLVAAAFSTLHEDGSLHLEIIPEYAGFLKSKKVVGVFVNGSSGEGFSFTTEERMKIAEAWVDASKHFDLKVIIHVGHTSVAEECKMAAHAQEIGAGGVASVGPIYFKAKSPSQLVDWCAQVAAAAPALPYYFYNIPRMSGNVVSMIDFISLAKEKIPNFAGIKFSDPGDFPGLLFCQCFDNARFDIMHGQDESLLSALTLGITSAIGSTYSFAAPVYTKIIDAFSNNDLVTAREYQLMSVKLVAAILGTGELVPTCKAVLRFLGLDLGTVRPPHVDLDASAVAGLKKKLENLGFFKICG